MLCCSLDMFGRGQKQQPHCSRSRWQHSDHCLLWHHKGQIVRTACFLSTCFRKSGAKVQGWTFISGGRVSLTGWMLLFEITASCEFCVKYRMCKILVRDIFMGSPVVQCPTNMGSGLSSTFTSSFIYLGSQLVESQDSTILKSRPKFIPQHWNLFHKIKTLAHILSINL